MGKAKRRLSEKEVESLKQMMAGYPRPSLRSLARFFGVNQPSILKSLGLWGTRAGVLLPNERVKIEGYTTKVNLNERTNVA